MLIYIPLGIYHSLQQLSPRGGEVVNINLVCDEENYHLRKISDDEVKVVGSAVTITGTWNPSDSDKITAVVISGEVTLTGKTDCYSLTFASGGHLTINAGARLRVWEGGITNNDCSGVSYLTIWEDDMNSLAGELLLHPDVTVNNHPKANVVVTARNVGYIPNPDVSGNYLWTWYRLSLPIEMCTSWSKSPNIGVYVYVWSVSKNDWESITSLTKMIPFEIMTVAFNTSYPLEKIEITFPGNIFINSNITIVKKQQNWGIGNSWLGRINTTKLLSFCNIENFELYYTWDTVVPGEERGRTRITQSNISQFPYFYPAKSNISTKGSNKTFTLNYKDLVWDPSFEDDQPLQTRSLSKGQTKGNTEEKPIDTELLNDPIFQNPQIVDFSEPSEK